MMYDTSFLILVETLGSHTFDSENGGFVEHFAGSKGKEIRQAIITVDSYLKYLQIAVAWFSKSDFKEFLATLLSIYHPKRGQSPTFRWLEGEESEPCHEVYKYLRALSRNRRRLNWIIWFLRKNIYSHIHMIWWIYADCGGRHKIQCLELNDAAPPLALPRQASCPAESAQHRHLGEVPVLISTIVCSGSHRDNSVPSLWRVCGPVALTTRSRPTTHDSHHQASRASDIDEIERIDRPLRVVDEDMEQAVCIPLTASSM